MDIKAYLLRLTAAAIICGIAGSLVRNKKMYGSLVKLLCGAFMALVVISPVTDIQLEGLTNFSPQIHQSAQDAVAQGKNTAMDAWVEGIKQSAQAYILDKAESYGAQLEVDVTVERSDPPALVGVRIKGSISPYGKQILRDAICQQLGIAEEDQIWTG